MSQPPFGPPAGPPGPPPGPPPAQPPFGQPPFGPPPGADYAAFGGGATPPPRQRSTKKWLIGGGAVVAAAALVGGGAFAAASLLGGGDGAQPAEALPASTFAYASVDLSDLNDAFSMLAKFPGLTDGSGFGSITKSGGDPREKLVNAVLGSGGDFCGGLSWQKDFQPWLGQKAAVAGVELNGQPEPVVVVQVEDADAAKAAFDKFNGCDDSPEDAAYAITDHWALLSDDQDAVNTIAKKASSGSLADDSDYQHWTGQVGDLGVATFYAAPSAGDLIAKVLKERGGRPDILTDSGSDDEFGSQPFGGGPDDLLGFCPGLLDDPGAVSDSYEKYLDDFSGAAATIRFNDGGVELETAADLGQTVSASNDAGSLVTSLPDDTAAAVGVSVGDDWFESALGGLGQVCGDGFDQQSLEDQLSSLTGLDVPDDIDTLLGDGLTISLGGDVDPSSFDDPSTAPVGIKVKGDPDAIERVVGKISNRLGGAAGVLGSDRDGDMIAIGPNESYRQSLLGDGGLGGDKTFQNVVPDADRASAIVYVNFNHFDGVAGSGQDAEDFKVLDGLGLSAWYDGTTQHSFLRLSTD